MDLNKPVDLEQFHEELSIIRHLEKMDPTANPKQTKQEEIDKAE